MSGKIIYARPKLLRKCVNSNAVSTYRCHDIHFYVLSLVDNNTHIQIVPNNGLSYEYQLHSILVRYISIISTII